MSGLFGGSKVDTTTPVISSLKLQTSCYGRAKPWVFGTARVTPNVIDYVDFTATPHTSTQKTGKGGGGAQSSTSYTYSVATIMALCSGPIGGIERVWADKEISSLTTLKLDFYSGSFDQAPWPYMVTQHADRALSYRGLSYVASGSFDLGDSASFGNHSMEVRALNTVANKYPGSVVPDAEVADVIAAILTDENQGIGMDPASIDGLEAFRDFCLASGIWISPAYTEQKAAGEYLRNLLDIGFADCVYSGGIFKIVPYSDVKVVGDLATFNPVLAPVYALTEDDFIPASESEVITVKRKNQDECYNSIQIKFADRANDYNDNVITREDQADIENTRLRQKDVSEFPEIADAAVASKVGDFIKHRSLYIRNEYQFRLPWKYILLEPMDVVTLTYPRKHLDGVPVLITEIEEDEDTGELIISAEDYPLGTNAPSLQAPPTVEGTIPNFAVEPGNALNPAIFEAPLQLTQNRPQIWMAAAGGIDWGGCEVWVSTDNASYQRVGRVLAPARYGSLTEPLGLGGVIDPLNVAAVDLSASRGVLLGATEANARDLVTLCYVGGEYISYANAALSGVNAYRLSYLVRGAYGTEISAHPVGTPFVRVDEAMFKYDYPKEWLGKTIWIKLVSFNRYGGGLQDQSKVAAHQYQIQGAPLGLVQNLRLESEWVGIEARLSWDLLDGADSYDIEVQGGTPVEVRRVVTGQKGNQFVYSTDDMSVDGGPWRQLVLRVRARAITGKTGPWSQLLASNEQVGPLEGIHIDVGFAQIVLKCSTPDDPDFEGILVWASKDQNFVPTVENAEFDGPGTLAFLANGDGAPLVQGDTYYVRAAGYDRLGKDQLSISASYQVVIPRNIASDVLDGVIKESHLVPALGSKIEFVTNLEQKLPGAALDQLLASQEDAQGDRDAIASNVVMALVQADQEGRVAAQQINTVAVRVGQNESSIRQVTVAMEGVASQVTDITTKVGENTGAIQQAAQATATLAEQVTTVSSTVDGNTAKVQLLQQATDGLEANLFLKASVNGRIAGMALGIKGDVSELAFLADRFLVAASDAAVTQAMFSVITVPTVIGGVEVQPGMYVNAAFINAAMISQAIIGFAIIDGANIKDASIAAAHILDATISTAKIRDAAITTAKIGDAAINTAKIGDAAITTAKINDLAVTNGKIANLAVDSAKIANLAVGTAKIADLGVTNAKIGNLAVDSAKIGNAAVETLKIAGNAVIVPLFVSGSSSVSGTLTLSDAASVAINFGGDIPFSVEGGQRYVQLLVNGSSVKGAWGGSPTSGTTSDITTSSAHGMTLAAGTHTFEVRCPGGVSFNVFLQVNAAKR